MPNMELKNSLLKTDKGQDEIATRQNRLPARVRTMLITVDGQRSVQELVSSSLFGESGAQSIWRPCLKTGISLKKTSRQRPLNQFFQVPPNRLMK